MSEMTEWFPATIKPARRGWYEVANVPAVHRNSSAFLTGRMRYWDGKQWWGAWFPELAYKWATIFGAHTTHHWRGLAREAEMSENEKRLRDKARSTVGPHPPVQCGGATAMSEYVMVRRDVLRARLRQLESVIAADNDDHDALADVRGWMETVLSQSSACKVCGGGGYVIADPPDGVGDCPACNTAIAQPEAQPVAWRTREIGSSVWHYNHSVQPADFLEPYETEPLYAGPFTSTPVRWEYRWLNPGGDPSRDGYMGWSLLEPRTTGQNQSQAIHEMMGYRYNDKPVYEVRPLYAGPALPNEGDSDGH